MFGLSWSEINHEIRPDLLATALQSDLLEAIAREHEELRSEDVPIIYRTALSKENRDQIEQIEAEVRISRE